LNTSSYLGFLKEIFVDHTIDGVEIPSSIFFIGAINPYQETTKNEQVEFVVNKMPKSKY
jgi:hypothetical protein